METIEVRLAGNSAIGRDGERIALTVTPSQVHDPTELPTYLAGYKNAGMRAESASPAILVDKEEDKYRTFDPKDTFQRVDVKASVNSWVREVDPRTSLTSYKVVHRFIGSFVNQFVENAAAGTSAYKPRQAAARRCSNAIMLDRENDVWSLLTTSANWAAAQVTTLGAGFQWNGGVNARPLRDLQSMCEVSDMPISSFWMNQPVANWLLADAEIRVHMRQMLGDAAVAAAITSVQDSRNANAVIDFAIPGLPPINVVAGKQRTESTGLQDFILPNHVVATHAPDGVPTDGEDIATTYTFRLRGPAGNGWETREYRIEGRGPRGGTMVVALNADIAVLTGPSVGGLLRNVLQ